MAIILSKPTNKWRQGRGETGTTRALLVGMQTGAAALESSVEVPQKVEHGTALGLSNSTLGNSSKETPNTNWKEYMHPCVHCSLIYNHHDLEAAHMSIRRGVDKTNRTFI